MKTPTAFLLLTGLLACAAQPASVPAGASPLRAQITSEIGGASCSQHAECRTLPLGHKACGGPEAYVAWSTASGNAARLDELARRYADQRRTEVERSGLVSNCMVTPDPGAQCVAQRCVLRERAGPGSPQVR